MKVSCGWTIICINGEPIVVIVRVQCHTSKRTAVRPTKRCSGSCWRQRICQSRHGANRIQMPHRCSSETTKLGFSFCRNSSQKPIISRWTSQIAPHRNFHRCTMYHWHGMQLTINHMWGKLRFQIAFKCKRRMGRRQSWFYRTNEHTRIYEIFFSIINTKKVVDNF